MPLSVAVRTEKDRPLTLLEERALDDKIQQLLDERDGVEIVQGVNSLTRRDKQQVNQEIARLVKIKTDRGVTRADGKERDEVLKEIKALEERLHPGMPNLGTYMNTKRSDGTKFLRLKAWCDMNNSDANRNKLTLRWKSLRRRLEPDDPQIANTMYLHPDNGW